MKSHLIVLSIILLFAFILVMAQTEVFSITDGLALLCIIFVAFVLLYLGVKGDELPESEIVYPQPGAYTEGSCRVTKSPSMFLKYHTPEELHSCARCHTLLTEHSYHDESLENGRFCSVLCWTKYLIEHNLIDKEE